MRLALLLHGFRQKVNYALNQREMCAQTMHICFAELCDFKDILEIGY